MKNVLDETYYSWSNLFSMELILSETYYSWSNLFSMELILSETYYSEWNTFQMGNILNETYYLEWNTFQMGNILNETYYSSWNPPRYGPYEALVFWINLLFSMKPAPVRALRGACVQNELYTVQNEIIFYHQWNPPRYGLYEALVFRIIFGMKCII